jgi:hypothetical protein
MLNAAAPSSEWHACDGSTIHQGADWHRNAYAGLNPNDYHRRVGRFSGALNFPRWRARLPRLAGWVVSLADNPSAAALPANTPTAQHPPAGTTLLLLGAEANDQPHRDDGADDDENDA